MHPFASGSAAGQAHARLVRHVRTRASGLLRACVGRYVQMQFDVDPALEQASDLEPKYARDRVARALVKGSSTQPRDGVPATQYVAYLLPKDKKAAGGEGDEEAERETEAEAAQAEAEDEEAGVARTELEWVREYAYEVIRQEEGAAYFFVMGSDSVVRCCTPKPK
eukprot:6197688-Pleurochrysis_carterae.AAC.3